MNVVSIHTHPTGSVVYIAVFYRIHVVGNQTQILFEYPTFALLFEITIFLTHCIIYD